MQPQRPRLLAGIISAAVAVSMLPAMPASAADPPAAPGVSTADRTRTRINEEGSRLGMDSVKSPSANGSVSGPTKQSTGSGAAVTQSRPVREVLGFAYPGSLGDGTVGYPSWQFDMLSTVVFFGLHVGPWDGYIENDSNWNVWNSPTLGQLVSTAHSRGVRVLPSINLFDFGDGTMMCSGLIPANRAHTISQIRNEVIAKGVDGVNVDYEGYGNQCASSPPTARDRFTSFVAELRAAMPGYYIVVDSYGGSANDGGQGFFNVPALNGNLDAFMVMAYDLEYSDANQSYIGCATGPLCLAPTSPRGGYPWRQELIADQYNAVVPSSKVIMGIPYYARFACVDARRQNARVTGTVFATSYLGARTVHDDPTAHDLVEARDPLDPVGAERMDWWNDAACGGGPYGNPREMYWDDAEALGRKYDMVNAKNLGGVGIFTLSYGGGAPELWNTIASRFSLIPGIPVNVTAWGGDHVAVLQWGRPSSVGGPITSYTVTASPGGATTTINGDVSGGVVSNLDNGTSYTFTVRATNAYGSGPTSAPSNPATPTPSQCTSLSSPGSGAARGQVVSWGPGRIDVFAKGSGGTLWHTAWGGGPAWGGPESQPGPPGGVASDPVATSRAPNRLDVFAIGGNGDLYHKVWTGSAWLDWEAQGNPGYGLTGQVTAVAWSADRLDLFARTGSPSQLWHKAWNGVSWSGWEAHGSPAAAVGDPTLVAWSPGRLDLFAVGSDGKLYHQAWPGGWDTWESHGTPGVNFSIAAPALVAWGPNRLDFVLVDVAACTLWHRAWDGAAWSGWEPHGAPGGMLTTDPSLVAWAPGRLDWFVVRGDRLSHKGFGGGWFGWEDQGKPAEGVSGRATAGSWGPDRLDVFASGVGSPGHIYHNAWQTPGPWGYWEDHGIP